MLNIIEVSIIIYLFISNPVSNISAFEVWWIENTVFWVEQLISIG